MPLLPEKATAASSSGKHASIPDDDQTTAHRAEGSGGSTSVSAGAGGPTVQLDPKDPRSWTAGLAIVLMTVIGPQLGDWVVGQTITKEEIREVVSSELDRHAREGHRGAVEQHEVEMLSDKVDAVDAKVSEVDSKVSDLRWRWRTGSGAAPASRRVPEN